MIYKLFDNIVHIQFFSLMYSELFQTTISSI